MSCGLLFHQLFFRREVGVEEGDEDDGEGNDGNPDRLADEEMAEDRANYRAKCEEKKHSGVSGPLFAVGFVAALAVVQFLCRLCLPDGCGLITKVVATATPSA